MAIRSHKASRHNPPAGAKAQPVKTPAAEPRDCAARILERITDGGAFLDAAEAAEADQIRLLSPSNRALARRLTLAALRRLPEIDALIDARLQHALAEDAAPARHALRIVAAETVFLDGPAYASVGAAVSAVKRRRPSLAGLVNAVGRKIAALGPAAAAAPEQAARLNAPGWLADALAADWGAGAMQACLRAHLETPPLDLTVKSPETARAVADALDGVVTPSGSVRAAPRGPVTGLPGFDDGLWWVQDAAAALPCLLLAPAPGETILDLCAAPGGKTLQLAAAGARVTALDHSAPRSALIRENLDRTGLDAPIVVADALDPAAAPGPFDAVLVDAPCTATGTVRRHPDLPHIKDLSELAALTERQDQLLDAAWARLRPGGRLVFCTCSVLRAEGEERRDAALSRWADADPDPPGDAAAARLGAFLNGASLRTLPGHWPRAGGLDGFFAVRLRKRG